MILNNELVRMQKEAIMAVPYVAISAFAWREDHEKPQRDYERTIIKTGSTANVLK